MILEENKICLASPVPGGCDTAGIDRTLLSQELPPARPHPSPGGQPIPQQDLLQLHLGSVLGGRRKEHELLSDPVLARAVLRI